MEEFTIFIKYIIWSFSILAIITGAYLISKCMKRYENETKEVQELITKRRLNTKEKE